MRFLSKHQPSFSFKGQATSHTPAKWSNLANSPISNSPKLLDKNTRLIYTGLTSTCSVVAKIITLLRLVFFSLRLKPCTVASFAFLSSGFGEFEMGLLNAGYFNNRELKHAMFLRHGRQPEVNISHARTVVFSRFSN